MENEITKLQRLISIVPQKINLLDDTIKNNILFAQKYKDEKNVNERINNLKNLCLLDYVDHEGWDTVVGENGAKLSGGQIQRLE